MPAAVLFACNRNAIRSPMAAAIFKHLTGGRIYAESAGVRPGEPDPFAAAVMDEIGIDIHAHQPIAISDLHDASFDVIVSLTPEAHHQALELTRIMPVEAEYWPTQDPTLAMGSREQILDAYRQARDSLFARIKERFGLAAAPTA